MNRRMSTSTVGHRVMHVSSFPISHPVTSGIPSRLLLMMTLVTLTCGANDPCDTGGTVDPVVIGDDTAVVTAAVLVVCESTRFTKATNRQNTRYDDGIINSTHIKQYNSNNTNCG